MIGSRLTLTHGPRNIRFVRSATSSPSRQLFFRSLASGAPQQPLSLWPSVVSNFQLRSFFEIHGPQLISFKSVARSQSNVKLLNAYSSGYLLLVCSHDLPFKNALPSVASRIASTTQKGFVFCSLPPSAARRSASGNSLLL